MSPHLTNKLLVIALVWVAASFLLHETYSVDIWWQLVIGGDIIQTFDVPQLNVYTAGALNQPYHDSHWLFQVILAISHAAANFSGPTLLMMLVWGATLAITFRETSFYGGVTASVFATFLVVGASAERFLPRPEIVTFLMVALFYMLLERSRYKTNSQITLLAALQIVWVNSHGLFVIGPFMVGCYWLVHAVNFARGKNNNFQQLSATLAIIFLSLFASPHGADALEYSLLLFSEVGKDAPHYMKAVNELSPTFGHAAMGASAFWFFLLLLLLFLVSVATNLKKLSVPRFLITSALLIAALTGRRNIVLFALVAAPFIGEHLLYRVEYSKFAPWKENGLKISLLFVLLAWSIYPLSGAYYLDMQIPARVKLGVTPDFFPHDLPDFIRQNNIQGQVYNTSELGGFYMYHLYPDRMPFLDGRWEVYGDSFFDERATALTSYAAWKRWSTGYAIRSVLLHHTSPESKMLAPALYQDNDWSLVYYDFAASYFVRNDTLGTATPITFSDSSALLSGHVRPDARLILSSFYRNMGLKSLLLNNLEQIASMGLHKRNTLLEMAKLNIELHNSSMAEHYLLSLLKLDNFDTESLSELSFIYYQQKQFATSLYYSERAVTSSPGNSDTRLNHALVLLALNRQREALEEAETVLANDPHNKGARALKQQLQPLATP